MANTNINKANAFYDVKDVKDAFLHIPYDYSLDINKELFEYDETLYGNYTNIYIIVCDSPV